jgi:hypothetical protein
MNVKRTDKKTNEEIWRITKQKPIEIQTKRRKWNWIGHTLRKEAGAIQKTVLDCNPRRYRRRGRPKRTWQRTTEDEIRNKGSPVLHKESKELMMMRPTRANIPENTQIHLTLCHLFVFTCLYDYQNKRR